MRPKILSPNVRSSVGEIGNEINKAVVVPNIVTSKRSLTINPWVFIINTCTHQLYQIPCLGIYVPVLLLRIHTYVLPNKGHSLIAPT